MAFCCWAPWGLAIPSRNWGPGGHFSPWKNSRHRGQTAASVSRPQRRHAIPSLGASPIESELRWMGFDMVMYFEEERPVANESSAFLNLDQGSAKNTHILHRGFGTLDADWTYQQMLFQGGQLDLIFHHAKAVRSEEHTSELQSL